MAVATADKKISVYNYNSRTVSLAQEAGAVTRCLAYSPSGERLVTGGDDGTVRIWDANSGKELRHFANGSKGVTAIAATPDGKQIVTGGSDGVLRVWAMPREKPVTKTAARFGGDEDGFAGGEGLPVRGTSGRRSPMKPAISRGNSCPLLALQSRGREGETR